MCGRNGSVCVCAWGGVGEVVGSEVQECNIFYIGLAFENLIMRIRIVQWIQCVQEADRKKKSFIYDYYLFHF